ncbi:RNA polymerase sigma factor [Rhodoplanes sp. TEM]|uniref:RNA polymerase sigma factor n=1 Tax=Rhodoplanes tepidamans TaxID=200616 RepID=A0ABT5JBN2_RHOTP|nr:MULTISPECIES: RNA polymerase sigma factor [Rhodoplanes]MDC7787017.1 RNA polymerase sigma factor [Rhodoplanes tepidamans]MDC7986973.1 RNA polymerase sigma factor [Rhodoplanes sp. TEM]MDQ0354258.1 RNA polymerase sigma-70 factor (ECF subfamily) [Rhodoplanes tepidamans]
MQIASPETNRAILRELLVEHYHDLGRQLAQRLGSMELAREALQETFLRLERIGDIGPMRSPKAYLLRIALNVAIDGRRAESRRLTDDEVDSLLALPDDSPDPYRTIEARSDVEALKRAIAELPQRRRDILVAARVGDVSHRDLAERFGVSVRTIEIELKSAVEHCAARLGRKWKRRFGPRPRDASSE